MSVDVYDRWANPEEVDHEYGLSFSKTFELKNVTISPYYDTGYSEDIWGSTTTMGVGHSVGMRVYVPIIDGMDFVARVHKQIKYKGPDSTGYGSFATLYGVVLTL